MSSKRYRPYKMSEDELRDYGLTRQTVYPTTWRNLHPSDRAEDDYRRYSDRTNEANVSTRRYNSEYTSITGSSTTDINTLSYGQHGSLLEPAAEAATATLMNVESRIDFLTNNPYGYKNARKRRTHEGYVDTAIDAAEHYRSRFDAHLAGKTVSCDPDRIDSYDIGRDTSYTKSSYDNDKYGSTSYDDDKYKYSSTSYDDDKYKYSSTSYNDDDEYKYSSTRYNDDDEYKYSSTRYNDDDEYKYSSTRYDDDDKYTSYTAGGA